MCMCSGETNAAEKQLGADYLYLWGRTEGWGGEDGDLKTSEQTVSAALSRIMAIDRDQLVNYVLHWLAVCSFDTQSERQRERE